MNELIKTNFQTLEQEIRERKTLGKPLLVGINGVDTSGKSSFTKAFANYLHDRGHLVQVIHLDDFHNPKDIRSQGKDPVWSYLTYAFDLHRLVKEILQPVHEMSFLRKTMTVLDLETDRYSVERSYAVTPETIVLLEGVLLYREPIVNYLDYKVFLHISFEEVLRRAEQRDVPLMGEGVLNKYKAKYIPVQEWYIEHCDPLGVSDLVIDNEDYGCPKIVF